MIPADILERLPDAARQKLLLLDGLSDEARDLAQGAQGRLNDLARRPGAEDNPSVPRLGAVVATQEHRRSELFGLINGIQRWVKGLPPDTPIDVVAAPAPPSLVADDELSRGDAAGPLTPEEVVMKVRAKIGELTVERL